MNTLDEMKQGDSTHIRLCSASVKNFDLYKGPTSESGETLWSFGFSLRKGYMPKMIFDEEDDEKKVLFLINQEGLESLVNFLNRLMEERE